MTAEVQIGNASREDAAALAQLISRATAVDGVEAISEEAILALRQIATSASLAARIGDRVVGFASVEATDTGAVLEIVVDPKHRRTGIAKALLHTLDINPEHEVLIWAHGNIEAAQGFATAVGLTSTRVLWQMRRPLSGEIPEFHVPAGITIRSFRPGLDDEEWVLVNSRAFVSHPEQGKWDIDDLQIRENEPWFDPDGFLVAEVTGPLGTDAFLPVGAMAGSHWTKVHPSAVGSPGPIGEVYVVGIDPYTQGIGLGKALTLAGLHYLRSLGLAEVMLYVDEDNTSAMTLYEALGFTKYAVDVQYLYNH